MAARSSTYAENSIERRLNCLESTVQSLAGSVEEALHGLSTLPRMDLTRTPNIFNRETASEDNRSSSPLYIGPSHSFSVLQGAPAGIDRLPRQGLEESRQGAMSEIRNLLSAGNCRIMRAEIKRELFVRQRNMAIKS